MIDLTPLDVRKKRGDFSGKLRGYDPQEVDNFLEEVAARLEELVKENILLTDRAEMLQERVDASDGREKAVQEALVTAQELRADVKAQANREAGLIEREARVRIDKIVGDAERHVRDHMSALEDLERHRNKFLKSFRTLLERELDAIEIEESREPLEDVTVDLDLGVVWSEASSDVKEGAAPLDVEEREPEEPAEAEADEGDLGEMEGPEDGGDEEMEEKEDAADASEDVGDRDGGNQEDGGGADTGDESDRKALWLYDLDESGGERD
jgi:cell division initiation protein